MGSRNWGLDVSFRRFSIRTFHCGAICVQGDIRVTVACLSFEETDTDFPPFGGGMISSYGGGLAGNATTFPAPKSSASFAIAAGGDVRLTGDEAVA
jgi:hypothetical protein